MGSITFEDVCRTVLEQGKDPFDQTAELQPFHTEWVLGLSLQVAHDQLTGDTLLSSWEEVRKLWEELNPNQG